MVKKYLWGLLVLLLVAMGSLYLIPMGRYLPELEQILSKQLHFPVKVVSLNLAAFPLPHLDVHGVEVGGVNGISVQTISVVPDFVSLLSGKPEVRQVSVAHATVNYALLQKLIAVQQSTPSAGKSPITLREFTASDVTLITPWMTLKDVEAQVHFDDKGKLEKIWGALDQQHLTATLLPAANRHFSVNVMGKNWAIPRYPRWVLDNLQIEGVVSERDFVAKKLTAALGDIQLAASGNVSFGNTLKVSAQLEEWAVPLDQAAKLLEKSLEVQGTVRLKGKLEGSGANFAELRNHAQFTGEVRGQQLQMRLASAAEKLLLLDDLTAQVQAQNEQVTLSQLTAALYDGKLTGTAQLSGMLLNADLAVNDVEMASLVAALTNRVLFSGQLAGKSKMKIPLHTLASFPQDAQVEGDFHIQKGVLSKVDLLKAASLAKDGKPSDQPDTTEFEDFTGVAQLDSTGYHFKKLNLNSGVLKAQGRVDLTPTMQLSGALDADLKGTMGLVSVPLIVSGTVDQPHVAPNGAFLAGAALGTAVMPGIGTVVGMKIGGLFNKLFSKGDEHDTPQSAVPSR
jgi:hypothetical protein